MQWTPAFADANRMAFRPQSRPKRPSRERWASIGIQQGNDSFNSMGTSVHSW
ncbi:MAG: hypothetical protein ACTS46_01210 [Candidatus Hodgkinia cicadicola]